MRNIVEKAKLPIAGKWEINTKNNTKKILMSSTLELNFTPRIGIGLNPVTTQAVGVHQIFIKPSQELHTNLTCLGYTRLVAQ